MTAAPMDAKKALREAKRRWRDDGCAVTTEDAVRGTVYHVGIRFVTPGWDRDLWGLRTRGCGLSWEQAFLDADLTAKLEFERSKRRSARGPGFRGRRRGKARV